MGFESRAISARVTQQIVTILVKHVINVFIFFDQQPHQWFILSKAVTKTFHTLQPLGD